MLLSLVREHLRPYRQSIVLIVLFQLVSTIASLYLPGLNAQIIDEGVVTGDTAYIVRTGVVMLGVTFLQITCSVVAVYFGARTAMALGRDLRDSVFVKVESFAAQEVGQFGAPSLITRSTNDIQQVQMMVLLTFTMMITAPIMCIGGIIMAVHQDLYLSSLLVVIVPTLVTCIGLIVMRMRPLFRSMQAKIDLINRILREQIGGVRVIRAFVKDTHEQQRFDGASTDLMDVSIRVGRLMALMFPTLMLIMNVSSVAVMWVAGHRIADGQMQIGTLTAFLSYLLQILMSVMMATFMFVMLPRAEVSAERISEVLDTVPSVRAPQEPQVRSRRTGEVELREATFCYPGAQEAVLHGISLLARPGETTAIVGSTGSGKSTLLNLIPRLVDVTGGMVLVDDHDIRSLDPKDLRSSIGLVPQRPYLFGGTVATNLRYGKADATDDELWEALEIAQARGFVEAMPQGLDSVIAQGGTNVSGGQRQRLAIARAVVKAPEIYLFDDSFSALDYDTDARLRAALTTVTSHSAVIIVAQRISTIRRATRIVVLDEGSVVGTGTHTALMSSCEIYREIVLSQLSEEEAA
ncbi:MAG: ATP-binding cassette, subfamily multidrug efflux pump [Actinomycetota bacterium]|jgi:ATP-binding cassette subfamily B protein|nr:ATP-binding cassette, subfamily multidrug efflux pump [Actinomycetota bacterium]